MILRYYSDKNLAYSEASKIYDIECSKGDTQSCSKLKNIKLKLLK